MMCIEEKDARLLVIAALMFPPRFVAMHPAQSSELQSLPLEEQLLGVG